MGGAGGEMEWTFGQQAQLLIRVGESDLGQASRGEGPQGWLRTPPLSDGSSGSHSDLLLGCYGLPFYIDK